MNRLVAVLLERPDVIDQVADRTVVTFDGLLDLLGEQTMFGGHEWKFEDELLDRLVSSYLPVVAVLDWEAAVREAVTELPGWAGWRTVLLLGASGEFGVTAPHEYSSHEVVALFTGPEDDARILVCDAARRMMQLARGEEECPEVTRNTCGHGTCGCQLDKVWDPDTSRDSLVCRCPGRP
jgi:hypothetical protein